MNALNNTLSGFTLFVSCLLFSLGMNSCGTATAKSEPLSIEVQTSANCGMCKRTIETALTETEGVSSARLDLGNKVAYVSYDESKTDPAIIKKAIVNSGYDADEQECNKESHDALPACCQKDAAAH